MDPMKTILKLLQSPKWCEITPYEINNGDCEAFAYDVIDTLGGENENLYVDSTPEDEWFESEMPGHFWIVCQGRLYDAECPGGVTTRDELPIFAKWKRQQKA